MKPLEGVRLELTKIPDMGNPIKAQGRENKYQIAKEVLEEYYVNDCNTNSGIIPDDSKV